MSRIRLWIDRITTHPYGPFVLLTLALCVLVQLPGGRDLLEAAQAAGNMLGPYQPPPQLNRN